MSEPPYQPTLAQLRAFAAVATHLHFGSAATDLGISQPTLSQGLAALETGVPVAFGVLTCENVEQAEARIERGAEVARGALEMADLFGQMRAQAR